MGARLASQKIPNKVERRLSSTAAFPDLIQYQEFHDDRW